MSDILPGYRFYPTEEELVSFYLRVRLEGGANLNHVDRVIPVRDIYAFNPWQLPPFAGDLCRADPEQWFFFVPRQAREARGGRQNRQTESGYWKATGSPGCVYSSANRIIGEKKTMVYYVGRAPSGKKTEWKMNEYRAAVDGEAANPDHGANLTLGAPLTRTGKQDALVDCSNISPSRKYLLRQEFSVCRVYKKSKTVRAFDRRPPAAGIIIGSGEQAGRHGPNQPDEPAATEKRERSATDGLQIDISHQIEGETNRSSPESSFSSGDDGGGHHNLSHRAGESSNINAIDYDPLWEWDNLKFF